MTVHHADFAIPVTQRMVVSTSEGINGRVIALGWWVAPGSADDPDHVPTGTLYLVVDPQYPRPVWVPESDLTSSSVIS